MSRDGGKSSDMIATKIFAVSNVSINSIVDTSQYRILLSIKYYYLVAQPTTDPRIIAHESRAGAEGVPVRL